MTFGTAFSYLHLTLRTIQAIRTRTKTAFMKPFFTVHTSNFIYFIQGLMNGYSLNLISYKLLSLKLLSTLLTSLRRRYNFL